MRLRDSRGRFCRRPISELDRILKIGMIGAIITQVSDMLIPLKTIPIVDVRTYSSKSGYRGMGLGAGI